MRKQNNKRAGDSVKIHFSAQYVKPEIVENKHKNWVLNGKNNEYFKYINNRYLGSPTNAAIINNYCRLIYGLGLQDRNELDLSEYIDKKELRKFIFDFYSQGMAYFQVLYNRDKTLREIAHIEVDRVAPELEDDEGNINGYWFSKDWSDLIKYPAKNYPAFGTGKNGETEIFCLRPYKLGQDYFATPSYQAGLQYAEMEEEISNFCINHIKRGFSGGYIVHIPNASAMSEDDKDTLEKKIRQRLTGSSMAGSFVLDFAVGEEKIQVQVVEVNTSHKQWEVLREQAKEQIITAHEVVSPMLFGVRTTTGFSNNADELEEAERQTMKRVIRPIQEEITDSLESIFLAKGIETDLFFLGLSENVEAPEPEETTGADVIEVEASKHENTDSNVAEALIQLGEEINDDEWELIETRPVNGVPKNIETELRLHLAKAITSQPTIKSEQDTSLFRVRYVYAGNPDPEREFCAKMMSANRVYRKEDIDFVSDVAVNAGFGIQGADTYPIWLYKGGVNCKHFWERRIYLKRNNKRIGVNEARRMILELDPSEREAARWQQNEPEVAQIASDSNNNWRYTLSKIFKKWL